MPEKYSGPKLPLEQMPVRAAITGHNYYPHTDIFRNNLLHDDVLTVLSSAGIIPLRSRWRTKSQGSIREKFKRASSSPILDIYGIKIVVAKWDVDKTVKAIRGYWPMPEEFPWEGAQGNIKTTRTYGNQFSDPSYDTTRMNIMFDGDRIAEIQVSTPEQDERDHTMWTVYAIRRREALK